MSEQKQGFISVPKYEPISTWYCDGYQVINYPNVRFFVYPGMDAESPPRVVIDARATCSPVLAGTL